MLEQAGNLFAAILFLEAEAEALLHVLDDPRFMGRHPQELVIRLDDLHHLLEDFDAA